MIVVSLLSDLGVVQKVLQVFEWTCFYVEVNNFGAKDRKVITKGFPYLQRHIRVLIGDSRCSQTH